MRARALLAVAALLAGATVWLGVHACAVAEENRELRTTVERFRESLNDECLLERIDSLAERFRKLAEWVEAENERAHPHEAER